MIIDKVVTLEEDEFQYLKHYHNDMEKAEKALRSHEYKLVKKYAPAQLAYGSHTEYKNEFKDGHIVFYR